MTPTLPTRMNVVEIAGFGGPEQLQWGSRELPLPGVGEVLIRVGAAGVNRPDVLQRQGHYPPPPGASDLPGLEVAGEVVALGPDMPASLLGAEVCALLPGGGYAEYAVAAAALCLRVPAGLDIVQAATLPETGFTVWNNLVLRGRCGPGDIVLVHGGSSGIGVMAIQVARALGARVFATAGNHQKVKACEALGAERAINYRDEDFVEVLAAATGGHGADLILDMVGGDYTPRNLRAAAEDGRLVSIAVLHGAKAEIDIYQIMRKRLTLTGSTLRTRPLAEKAALARAVLDGLWPLIEAGRVTPVIHARFPLAEAAEAHRVMATSSHIGKLVLTV